MELQSAERESVALRVQAEQIADLHKPPATGRPSAFEDVDKIQRFLSYISDGNYRETACKASGFAVSTLHKKLKLAEDGDDAAIAFREALERAEGLAESETVRNVRNASKLPQFWAAGMTYLERKSPDRWGRRPEDSSTPKIVVQIGVKDGDVQVQLTAGHNPPALEPTQHLESPTNLEGVLPAQNHLILNRAIDASPVPPPKRVRGRAAKDVRAQRRKHKAQRSAATKATAAQS
jgi:hypothetical protein